MSDKEALARVKIDKLLEESGWRLLDDNQKRKNVVLEQGYRYDKKTKFTDYLLLDAYSRPLAVIEAKKKDYPLRSAKAQAMEYATRLGVRYFYLSNGEEHLFCDVQDGVLHPSDSFLNQDELIALTENSDIRKKLWEEACEDTLLAEIKVPNIQNNVKFKDEELRDDFLKDSKVKLLRDYQVDAVNAIWSSK